MAEAQKVAPEKSKETKKDDERLTCGIVMPISGNPDTGYSEDHWEEVKGILKRAIAKAEFEPHLVSESSPTAIIHEQIVHSLYNDKIIVCDVSDRNPNVMFELGMRLAFDKPIVIVKDNSTRYTFDVANIQHISYPISLTFSKIESFIDELSKKITDTYQQYKSDPEKHSFLQSFGPLTPQRVTLKDSDAKDLLVALNGKVEDLSIALPDIWNEIRRLKNEIDMERKFTNRISQYDRMDPEYRRFQNDKYNKIIRSGNNSEDPPLF